MGLPNNYEQPLNRGAELEPAGDTAPHAALVTRLDPREMLEHYRALVNNALELPVLAKMSVEGNACPVDTKPHSDLIPPSKTQQPDVADVFGQTFLIYPDKTAVQIQDDKVREIRTKSGKVEDIDYEDESIEKFKLNGTKYELKDGTFHYKKDGKEIDTGWTQAFASADGTFITAGKDGRVTLNKRDGTTSVLQDAKVSLDEKGNLTIERSDKSKEILTRDRSLMQIDAHGNLTSITYPNGDRRSFGYKGNQLVSVKDIDGKAYHLQNDKWVDEKGNDTGRSNVFVAADGTYGFRKKDGDIEVTEPGGKVNRLDEEDLGKDAKLYPDQHKREEENERIRKKIDEKGGLTKSGKTVIGDARDLSLDNTDLFHGSHVFVENADGKGDGGALYRKWKELSGAEGRTSSHASEEQQYQIKVGPGDAVVLFGITPDGNTWFQLERHPGRAGNLAEKGFSVLKTSIGNLFDGELSYDDAHGKDYHLYRKIRQNVGPLGVSPHSDRNPVRVDWKR